MPKTVRSTLLIIAAVLGVTQLSIVYTYIDKEIFSSDLLGFPPKLAVVILVPAAICGILAVAFINNTKLSRIFAAIAAGITALTVLIPLVYYFRLYASFDTELSENAKFTFANLRYELGFYTSDEFITPNWLQILGTIALILWIICAAFPAKKGSTGMHGAHAAGMPNAFPNNAIPANPMPSSYPAPMSTAPVIPPTSQGAKFCTNCGKPLVGAAKFCAECGTPV